MDSSGQDQQAQQVYLAAAALAISLVALLATLLQLMQQFILTAEGFHRVGETVMGYWGKSRKLRWDFRQFRVEVKFETPVIFVCPPTNRRFPAGDEAWFIDRRSRRRIERALRRHWDQQTITYFVLIGWWKWVFGKREWWWEKDNDTDSDADGGDAALREAGSAGVLQQFWRKSKDIALPLRWTPNAHAKARVNTTQAELSSWIRLLDGLQTMEEQSAKWQSDFEASGATRLPPPPPPSASALGAAAPAVVLDRTLGARTMSVALQPYERSWDTMPTGLVRPYATTTVCHLVEMLAMLNVYWEEFDRSRARYRAQGNGFLVTGEQLPELGLVFGIQLYGKSRFEENRVIPDDGVKDLCFGRADTIYSWAVDSRRLDPTEIDNLGSLQLSNDQEIGETLRVIGCNAKTVNMFTHQKRTTHLFPLVFELLGMLARTFHMDNTLFRNIPNPTKFTWDRRAFSIREMLYAYEGLLAEHCEANGSPVKSHLLRILLELQPFLARFGEKRRQPLELALLQTLHRALDDMDEILTAKKKCPRTKGPATTAAGTSLVVETRHQEQRREMVQDVLRNHIQTVLYVLNRGEEELRTPRMSQHAMSVEFRYDNLPEHLLLPGTRVEDIDNAPPEGDRNKQKVLMDIYFRSIRQYVVDRARGTTDERTRWEASPRREFLSASPTSRHISRTHGLDPAAAAAAPAPAPEAGIQRAPTEPTHSSPKPGGDGEPFSAPGLHRTWTLPKRANTGSASSRPKSLLRVETLRKQVPRSVLVESEKREPVQTQQQQQQQQQAEESEKHASFANNDSSSPESASHEPEPKSLADLGDVTHDDVWCVLVLRMLCWLTLHDFHKKDRQMPNSEYLGSRLPVFIM